MKITCSMSEEIPIRSFGVSVIVLKTTSQSTTVLLLKRAEPFLNGEWCQIAGGIERGERAWETALRELKEETGLTPYALYSADICEQFYEVDKECISIFPVFVAFVDSNSEILLNEEHSEYRWMTVQEAEALLPFPGQRHILRHIQSQFIDRKPLEHLRISLPV